MPGNEVLVGGQPIGTVDDISLTEDAQAEVEITRRRAPARGHHRGDPRHLALGDRQPLRLDLARPQLGARDARRHGDPVEPDEHRRSTSTSSSTPSTAAPATGLAEFIQGQATVYTGNEEEANQAYKYLAPGLQSTTRLLEELTRDDQTFSEFLASGSSVLGAIAERRDDLAALTSNANQALGAIADRERGLRPQPRRPAARPAPGEHDLRQPARRARRPRPADRRRPGRRPRS